MGRPTSGGQGMAVVVRHVQAPDEPRERAAPRSQPEVLVLEAVGRAQRLRVLQLQQERRFADLVPLHLDVSV